MLLTVTDIVVMAWSSGFSKSAVRNSLSTTITVCSMKCSHCACWISTSTSRVSDEAMARNSLNGCCRFHSFSASVACFGPDVLEIVIKYIILMCV